MTKIAVLVGGSERVFSDYAAAIELLNHREFIVLVGNDMISEFPYKVDHLVTLHPTKLATWLDGRVKKSFPPCPNVWAHNFYKNNLVTNQAPHWGGTNGTKSGSCGAFMFKIARECLACDKIILCGIPLEPNSNHFVRHQRWSSALAFRRAWETRKNEIAPYVRSLSGGWTEATFTAPDAAWLDAVQN